MPEIGQMTCPHRPTSKGWSAGGGESPTTWCGYCKERVPVDAAWAETYYDKRRKWIERQVANGSASQRGLEENERDRAYILRLIAAAERHPAA